MRSFARSFARELALAVRVGPSAFLARVCFGAKVPLNTKLVSWRIGEARDSSRAIRGGSASKQQQRSIEESPIPALVGAVVVVVVVVAAGRVGIPARAAKQAKHQTCTHTTRTRDLRRDSRRRLAWATCCCRCCCCGCERPCRKRAELSRGGDDPTRSWRWRRLRERDGSSPRRPGSS